MGFPERFALVAGAHPYAWGEKNGFHKATIQGFMTTRKPQRKTLQRLVERTGIPEDWWLNGDGPPPPVKEPDADTADLVSTSGSKTTVIEVKTTSELAGIPYVQPKSSGTTVSEREPVSRYLVSEDLTGVDGKPIAMNAKTFAPAVSFVARILLVMKRQAWMPELDDAAHSQLVASLFSMLTQEAGGNGKEFDRLVESDGVVESGLRYLWEVQRCRAGKTDPWAW